MTHHNKLGFSLIEVFVSMLISSILLTAGLTIYNQISKTSVIIEKIIFDDTKIMILSDRLQTDLSGLSPLYFNKKSTNETKTTESKKPETTQAGLSKENFYAFFYSKNKPEQQLDFFTFVTTNAMEMFGSENNRFVRVIYKIEKEQTHQNQFKLMRKEMNKPSADFKDTDTTSGLFYELVSNITHFKIEYGFIEKSTEKEGSDKSPDQKYQWASQWGVVSEDQKTKEKQPMLPSIIKITIQFISDKNSKNQNIEHELFFIVPIQETNIKSFSQMHKEQEKTKNSTTSNQKQNSTKTSSTVVATSAKSGSPNVA